MLALRGARLLKNVFETAAVSELKDLLFLWTSRGANLSLAGPFLSTCVDSVQEIFASASAVDDWPLPLSKTLFRNTSIPFSLTESSALSDFLAQFSGRAVRWETLGLFLAAVSQATIVIPYYAPLYASEDVRQRLRKLMTSFFGPMLRAEPGPRLPERSAAHFSLRELQLSTRS